MLGIKKMNGLVKTSVISALLATTTAMYATNPVKKDAQPNQTEVVSKTGAEALKAMNLQEVNQASVPTIHNSRIDNTFRKFAKNEQEKSAINSLISSMYPKKGTFLASALMQHELDRQQLFLLLEERGDLLKKNNLNPQLGNEISRYGSNFYKSVRPNAKAVDKWVDNDYTPKIMGLLHFDHKPTAEEVIERLDDIAAKKANFTSDDLRYYQTASNLFYYNNVKKQKNNQTLSELIAHKIFTIDNIIFKKLLTNYNFFGENSKYNQYDRLSDFYGDWMDTVKPTGK